MMKFNRTILVMLAAISSLFMVANRGAAQPQANYQQMTESQRAAFVALQAQRLSQQISGREYHFTNAFNAAIQEQLETYVKRIGNDAGNEFGSGDARQIFQRGQSVAPTIIRIFKANNVSPLIGLYIPLVESEYINLTSPNSMGALGMFQFLPQTGARYGLTTAELLDVEKSANAAALYIAGGLKTFEHDPMKEALALLAYNRGGGTVERDVAELVTEQDRACSICALTEQRDKLDAGFQNESVYYVPRFFAAAIIGENPGAFGIKMPALSLSKTTP